MPFAARAPSFACLLLSVVACDEAQEPTFTATITVTSSERVDDARGPAMAGTARLEILSDIDQEIALQDLSVWARNGPVGDPDAIPWSDVATSGTWPLSVEADRSKAVDVTWRTSLPSACPDARYLIAAFATLIGTSGPPVEATDFAGDVTLPAHPSELPWRWLVTSRGELGGFGREMLAVGPDDVVWSTGREGLVRIDPGGVTVVGGVWPERMVADEGGAITLEGSLGGGAARLTAHGLEGQERWRTSIVGAELLWLVVATPDVVVMSGSARGEVTLGATRVPSGSPFVAAFAPDTGEVVHVRSDVARPRAGVALPDGGFVATSFDPQAGLLAFDASLAPRSGWGAQVTHVARHAAGALLVASDRAVTALSPDLAVLREAPAPCFSVEGMVALGDGGALLVAASTLILLDAEGRARATRQVDRPLWIAQRDDSVVVLWHDDEGNGHVGRLDVERLAEVGP